MSEVNDIMSLEDLKEEIEEQREMLQKYERKIEEVEKQEKEEQVEQREAPSLDREDFVQKEWSHFSKRPYILEQEGEGVYRLHVPSIVDFEAGRFIGTTEDGRFKTFLLDQTTKMLQSVPEQVRQDPRIELSFEKKFELRGNYLHYRKEEDREFLEEHDEVNRHLKEIGPSKAEIKPGHEFELIKDLFALGYDPFTPSPVEEEDLRDLHASFPFELYDYQEDWIDTFMENGKAAFCGPTGSGKTAPALEIMAQVKGPKAVIVGSRLTKQQWEERIEEHVPEIRDEVRIETYASVEKLQPEDEDFEYGIVVADECHALPADTFAGAALLPTKYRLGLSATPYREDDRSPYIFALTGSPTGMDWDSILSQQGKERHEVNVSIVDSREEKIGKASELFDPEKKTLVYTDSLDLGEELAEELGLSFVSGEDGSNQYEKAMEAVERDNAVVISRVGDQGFSVPGLEAIIEVDFLFGSRRQQLQRTGRLLHDDQGESHDVLFTESEWEKYSKRMSSPMNRGWEINFEGKDREVDLPDEKDSGIEIGDEQIDKVEDRETESVEASTSADTGEMSDIEVLKKDEVQEEAETRIGKVGSVGDDKAKKMLLYIAKRGEPVGSAELSTQFSHNKPDVNKLLKALREGKKSIIKEADTDGRAKHYVINREAVDEIIEAQKLQKDLEEDFDDVFG